MLMHRFDYDLEQELELNAECRPLYIRPSQCSELYLIYKRNVLRLAFKSENLNANPNSQTKRLLSVGKKGDPKYILQWLHIHE